MKNLLTNKWLLGLALPAVLLVGGLAATGNLPFTHSANDLITAGQKEETQVNADKKKSFIESQTAPNSGKASDDAGNTASTNTSGPASQPSDDTSISLSARQESNNSVTVVTKLYGYSSGSCQLQVTNGDQTESQSAEVIYQSQYSTCAGFSVPTGKLGAGTWNIKLTTTSEGLVKTKSISFKVQ